MPSVFKVLHYMILVATLFMILIIGPAIIFPAIYAINSIIMLVVLPLFFVLWVVTLYCLFKLLTKQIIKDFNNNPNKDK